MLKDKTVLLGVTGSIAAYKIATLASMLVKQHADVHVIMTKNATKTTSYNSKDKMKNLKFTSHQMINNNGKKIKVIPQKKTFGLQFKNGSSNTGKIATKVSSNNNKK